MANNSTRIKKSQNTLVKPFIAFLRRFHLLLFFVFIVACLSLAVIRINEALTQAPEQPYTSPISAGSIDQATLERIQSLQTSDEPIQIPALPEGRINPFSE